MDDQLDNAPTEELPFGSGAFDSSDDRESKAKTTKRKKAVKKTTKKTTKKATKKATKKVTKKAIKKVAKKAVSKVSKVAKKAKTVKKAAAKDETTSTKELKAESEVASKPATSVAKKRVAMARTSKAASSRTEATADDAPKQSAPVEPEISIIFDAEPKEAPAPVASEYVPAPSGGFTPAPVVALYSESGAPLQTSAPAQLPRDGAPRESSTVSDGSGEKPGDEANRPSDYREGESAGARRRRRWKERRKQKRADARAKAQTGGATATGVESTDAQPAQGGSQRQQGGQRGSQEGGRQGRQRNDGSKRGQRQGRQNAQQPGAQRQGRQEQSAQLQPQGGRRSPKPEGNPKKALEECEGLLVIEHASHGHLHQKANGYRSDKLDAHVAPHIVQKYNLRTGSMLKGMRRPTQGRHKWELVEVLEIDGKAPRDQAATPSFRSLTTIDPDFHYEVGDGSGETSLKVLDILCPVGRGQRGLIVAPPRTGKTVLLQQFARAIEKIYPEVHLMVLLVDERPEEATEWQRATNGEVFVSTNDETHKTHVDLCEVVWARCQRLVELGEDVILLLDSITRMARAYNNVKGNSGKTMSGGVDSRALERPKQFFGAARNTETAGSLTILGTCLIETGSRMDQVIFEEFKGTGNMELVLSRKLSERRIFPAIDVVKTGTRKEEKLLSSRRLRWINTLRRVLMRMHFAEAMELLTDKLDVTEKIDEFLCRFEVDPEK